jgi:hypothetical protein
MTPTEKAKKLVDMFRSAIYEGVLTSANIDMKREAYRNEQGKRCALIAVAELEDYADETQVRTGTGGLNNYEFWKQVKEEISKL